MRAQVLRLGLVASMMQAGGMAHAELIEVTAQYTRCDDLDLDSFASALGRLHGILQTSKRAPMRIGGRTVSAGEYAQRTVLPLLDAAGSGDRNRMCAAISKLAWYRDAQLPANKLLFSAYYTPTVPGSLTRDERFRYPLYRRPPGNEANRYDTGQILSGALQGRGLELVWLEDAYDALALHVEGSAQIQLSDGSLFAIGTNGTNGKPYQNVSKLLMDDGRLPKKSAAPQTKKPGSPRARAYFAAHPEELAKYWGRNAHYVYLKQVASAGGGKLGALTDGRSLAVDPTVYPLGTLVLLRPVRAFPGGDGTPSRLAISMDTGAAIKGAGRIDVYFGDDASTSAQVVSQGSGEGEAYVLVAH